MIVDPATGERVPMDEFIRRGRERAAATRRRQALAVGMKYDVHLHGDNTRPLIVGVTKLRLYIVDAAGIAEERKGWLFRTSPGHNATMLTEQSMSQADAWRMIRRRAGAAGIFAPIGNHTFRATGITAYLGNGGTLEHAQSMAAHESPRTTKLYDRTEERLTQNRYVRFGTMRIWTGQP
jgi:integrase